MELHTIEESYRAMFFFIDELYIQTGYDELAAGILSDMQLLPDNTSVDPAAKINWFRAVNCVMIGEEGNFYTFSPANSSAFTCKGKTAESLPTDSLTSKEAYKAMFFYIDQYYHEVSRPTKLGDILKSMSWQEDDSTTDPTMWEIWLAAVKKARSGEEGRIYLKWQR